MFLITVMAPDGGTRGYASCLRQNRACRYISEKHVYRITGRIKQLAIPKYTWASALRGSRWGECECNCGLP